MWRPGSHSILGRHVGLRSGGQGSSAASESHRHVQSDSEDEDGYTRIDAKHAYEKFHEVAPHEIDPLREVPAKYLLKVFEELWASTTAKVHGGDNEDAVLAQIHREYLPSLLDHVAPRHHHAVAPETVYIAWLFFVSDSGRLNSTDRMQFNDWALKEPLLPMPGWERGEGSERAALKTWADCVQRLEWYRGTKLPQIIKRNKVFGVHARQPEHDRTSESVLYREAKYVRFRLEDPLDPLSALLLIRTFELARTDIQPESTCIGLKDRLVSAFAHLVKEFRPSCPEHSSHYHDGLDEHNDPSREPPFLSLDPVCNPSRDELYRGFLLYTRGLATRQAFQDVDEVSQIIKIDAAWRTRCRKAIGLGPATVLLIDRAAEDRVLERYSWKAWKDEVLGGKKEEKREEEFEWL